MTEWWHELSSEMFYVYRCVGGIPISLGEILVSVQLLPYLCMTQLGRILDVQCSCRILCVCLVIFHKRLDSKCPTVVVLSGMQLLCEVSWYPEIINEIYPQIQEPWIDAWGDIGTGEGFRFFSSLLLLHCCSWEPFWGPTLLYGSRGERGTYTSRQGSVAQQVLPLFSVGT